MLKRIIASGLKGQKFDYEFGPGTAIMGPNDAGKTAILDAISFICRGKFPEVKKDSWPEATVSGVFDNKMVTRTINAKGTVKTDSLLSPDELAALDIPLLDPEHYFGLTDRERTNYVFERVKLPGEYTPESIIAEMERLSLEEEHTEDVEKAKKDLIQDIRSIFKDASFTLQEALGVAVENLRTRYTYWNKRCKETQGAVTTLTELKLRAKNVSAAPAGLAQEIENLTGEINRHSERLGALKQELFGAESAIATRKSLEKFLAEDRTDYDTLLKIAREKKLPIAQEFERVSDSIMGVDIGEMRKSQEELRKKADAAGREINVATDARNEAIQSLEELADLKECPYCHGAPKGWRARLRKQLEERRDQADAAIKKHTEIVETRRDEMVALGKQIESFEQTRAKSEELRQQLKLLGDQIDRITADKDRDTKKRDEWKERLATLQAPADPEKLRLDIKAAEQVLRAEQDKLTELHGQRTAETRLQQDIVRAGEAAKEHTVAQAQLLVTKKIAKLLEEKRNAMVQDVFQSLLRIANQFTDGILKSELVMVNGVIGRVENGAFIGHHWFGGTAKALTYIAIACALSADSPLKLVLLDEFGRLDEKNQFKVLDRLGSMQKEGVIDQFVVAGTSLPTPGILEKWSNALKIIEVK